MTENEQKQQLSIAYVMRWPSRQVCLPVALWIRQRDVELQPGVESHEQSV